jgi:site-specific DNA-adenine methylase
VLFPYFGGKSKVAPQVWAHLGDPEIYIEPFAGSLAVLFARPTPARTEIAVDLDGLIVNFFRTLQHDWRSMEQYLSGAVSEIDVYAKHAALLEQRDVLNDKLRADPEWHNTMLAAWWWEGISSWLGSGYGHRLARQRPHIDRSLKGAWATGMTDAKITAAAERLGNVILLAGDWKDPWRRAVTPAIINRFDKSVGVFMDPPYVDTARQKGLYAEDAPLNVQITAWALAQPSHVRTVIAGYADEYPELHADGWTLVEWRAPNGYAGKDNNRRKAEVLYLSPIRRRLVRRGTTPLPGGSRRSDRRATEPAAGDGDGIGQDGDGDLRGPEAPASAGGRPRRGVRSQVDQVAVGEGDQQVGSPSKRAGGRRKQAATPAGDPPG